MSETLAIHRSSGGRYATIFVLPLVWLLRPPRGKPAEPIEVGEMG